MVTVAEIAAKLKETSLFSCKYDLILMGFNIEGRGRAPALLSISGNKKRKLNPEAAQSQVEHQSLEIYRLQQQIDQLQAVLKDNIWNQDHSQGTGDKPLGSFQISGNLS